MSQAAGAAAPKDGRLTSAAIWAFTSQTAWIIRAAQAEFEGEEVVAAARKLLEVLHAWRNKHRSPRCSNCFERGHTKRTCHRVSYGKGSER